jgi:hypothetical protein
MRALSVRVMVLLAAIVISCKKCDAQPTGAAQTLLRVASQHPEALLDLQKV